MSIGISISIISCGCSCASSSCCRCCVVVETMETMSVRGVVCLRKMSVILGLGIDSSRGGRLLV